jgi:hypothetical protein
MVVRYLRDKWIFGLRVALLCILIFVSIANGFAAPATSKLRVKTLAAAEKISLLEFKKHTHNKVKNIQFRLIDETSDEYVFSYEDLDVIPRPGSDLYVTVKKATGSVQINTSK